MTTKITRQMGTKILRCITTMEHLILRYRLIKELPTLNGPNLKVLTFKKIILKVLVILSVLTAYMTQKSHSFWLLNLVLTMEWSIVDSTQSKLCLSICLGVWRTKTKTIRIKELFTQFSKIPLPLLINYLNSGTFLFLKLVKPKKSFVISIFTSMAALCRTKIIHLAQMDLCGKINLSERMVF